MQIGQFLPTSPYFRFVSSSCWDTEWTMMAHPPTHTRQTNWGIYRQQRETIHITPLERKTATVTCERCANFSFQGKSPHRHKPAELCVYIHVHIRRENLIEVKAGRDEFFRFLFFIFVWTSSPSSKKRWNNQHDTVQLRSYTYTVSTTSENVKVSFFFLFVCCAFFQLGHVL
jgi:hypothetical protein